jgi:hypothetical protein
VNWLGDLDAKVEAALKPQPRWFNVKRRVVIDVDGRQDFNPTLLGVGGILSSGLYPVPTWALLGGSNTTVTRRFPQAGHMRRD